MYIPHCKNRLSLEVSKEMAFSSYMDMIMQLRAKITCYNEI